MSENKLGTVKEVEHVTSAKPSNVFYGDSAEVQPVGFMDYNEFSKSTKRIQSMEGFAKEYRDIIDYIMSITHKIWEEKGIGVIYETYHNDVVMHTGVNSIQGVNEVVSGTLQTLHAFPDRKLYGENVIWSGNDKEGFLSSHRIVSNTTNLGDSSFGPATGKKVMFRTIVDCFVHSNRIVEEWLVRDNLYIVKQLGYNPVEVAKLLAKQSAHKGPALQSHFGISEVRKGQFMPEEFIRKSTAFEIGDFTLELYNKIWERRLFNYVNDFYAENANVHFICGTDLTGSQQIQGMLISLFASFPNAAFFVDRVTCNERNQEGSWDVAVRWRLQGLHEGIGYFGTPSGQPIKILGISHLQIQDEKVTEEWLTFDGLDVLKQIYMQIENDSNKKAKEEALA